MYYRLNANQENQLLNKPETGMGYQLIEASISGTYNRERFIVLNCELAVEINGYEKKYIREASEEGIPSLKNRADLITLSAIHVLHEPEVRNTVNESSGKTNKGAIDNPVERANGTDIFVRLSAFSNDKRIDFVRKCLRAGSYTTTLQDYLDCKSSHDDPVERYALPNGAQIQHAFHIQAASTDTLQKGIVQPANVKRGGGKEAYFDNGTAPGSFIKQTPY